MKIKHIINILEQMDPETDVIVYDPDEDRYYNCDFSLYKGYVCFEHEYGQNTPLDNDPEKIITYKYDEKTDKLTGVLKC